MANSGLARLNDRFYVLFSRILYIMRDIEKDL